VSRITTALVQLLANRALCNRDDQFRGILEGQLESVFDPRRDGGDITTLDEVDFFFLE
jgi:hypothetical protein